jgi:solute:Na+ symporter, SSS family
VLSAFDWIVIAAYLASMFGIGWYFSSRNRSFSDFMFGGGSMPWLAIGISLIATSVSASTFLGNPAESYARDMSLLTLTLGSLVAIVVISWVFIPRFRSSGIQSAYELLERRFSPGVRRLAASLYCAHLLLRTGLLIYVPSLVLTPILHLPMPVCLVVMTAIAILYTYHGGIKAVTWTDVVQFLIFFGSGLFALYYCAHAIGGFGETLSLAAKAGKTHWLDTHFTFASDRNLWTTVLVYSVFEVAIRGCDQQFVQRYLSCRNTREANLSSIASAIMGVAVGLIFFLLGAFLFVFYNIKHLAVLPTTRVDEVFPHFILNVMPAGSKGLLVAAILAAAMSSLSSAYTAFSNTWVVDLWPGDEALRLTRARRTIGWFGLVGIGAGMLCLSGNVSILSKALFFTSLFTGPLLALFLMAFFRPNLAPRAVLISVFVGMAGLMLFLDIPLLPKGMWQPLYHFAWPWNPVLSVFFTVTAAHILHPFFKAS